MLGAEMCAREMGILDLAEALGDRPGSSGGRLRPTVRDPDLYAAVPEHPLTRGSARMRACPPTR
jgi:hypothetical protein